MQPVNDTPTNHVSIAEMSEEQIDEMLIEIRKRREAPIKVYLEAQEYHRKKSVEGLSEKLTKRCTMFDKKRATIDKALTALEKYATEIKVIMIQMETM